MSYETRRAIYGKMSGDSTLTALLGTAGAGYSQSIYYQQAPTDADFPYVVFFQSAGTPTYTFDVGHAQMDDEVWTIKGVDRAESADAADNIAGRLDALLTDGTLTISGASQLYLRRESDMPAFSEIVDGIRYIHAGALFRLVYSA